MPKETVAQQQERVRRERAAAFDARAGAGRVGPPLPPKMADSAGATGGPSFAKNPMATGKPSQMLPKGNPGAGGFKGIAKPGEAVQVMLNGKKAFISGSAITDDSGPSPAPRSFLNMIACANMKTRCTQLRFKHDTFGIKKVKVIDIHHDIAAGQHVARTVEDAFNCKTNVLTELF